MKDSANILIIDDDIYIGNMEERILKNEGYSVDRACSGREAYMYLESHRPDLVLLDLMLPGIIKGEDILSRIKDIPVIVVSAKANVDDKVNLLMGGAQDYITKPFDIKELLARIEVQLRRSAKNSNKAAQADETAICYDNILIDLQSGILTIDGNIVRLTKTEYAILNILIRNAGHVIAKSVLLDRLADKDIYLMENSLKVHICNLKRKLRESGGREYIENVWGIGFKLE